MKAFLFTIMMSLAAGVPAFAADTISAQHVEPEVIRVVGNGSIEVMPDKATVHMAVVTKSKTSRQAQIDNATLMTKLRAALVSKYQIADKDFRTTSFTVTPERNEENPQQILGYTVRHSVAVTVYFTDRIGELIDLAVASGANAVDHIQWGLKNQRQYELEALKLAMQDAQLRAQAIAEAAGRPITKILKISQGEYSVVAEQEQSADSSEDSTTNIYPDLLIVNATLNVEYGF